MQVEEYNEEEYLGTHLYNSGMDEEYVSMWEHAERMTMLAEGLEDPLQELHTRFRNVVPPDVWEMILASAYASGQYQAAVMCLENVVAGELDPNDPRAVVSVEMGMEAARSFYAWRVVAIQVWTSQL